MKNSTRTCTSCGLIPKSDGVTVHQYVTFPQLGPLYFSEFCPVSDWIVLFDLFVQVHRCVPPISVVLLRAQPSF